MARPAAITRDALDHVALDLFLARSYPAVSVADLVEAAGISRPTFFRYASRREDLVLDHIAAFGTAVADAVHRHPARGWAALAGAICDSLESITPDSLTGKAFQVLRRDERLRSAALGLTRPWRRKVTASLLDRGDYGGDPVRCESAAAMAIGLAQMMWAQDDPRPDPRAVYADAPNAVRL
ncbi:TetR/AcrR family transcriptional regulator [Microlunatus speluncae]|uniref:TetR/AcrR family transcriptional regulator n=1 Tax=Microlunatus speluncae TaxID=2594267 RepID=UPI0012666EF1|nr:TetR/AcrR family transcriptional regulator [Microlunatus speluncae]